MLIRVFFYQKNLYKELEPTVAVIELKNYCEDNPSKKFIQAVTSVLKKYEK